MNDEGGAPDTLQDGSKPAPRKRTQKAVGDNFASRGEVAGQVPKDGISSAKKERGPPLALEDSDVPGTGGLFAGAAGGATGGALAHPHFWRCAASLRGGAALAAPESNRGDILALATRGSDRSTRAKQMKSN